MANKDTLQTQWTDFSAEWIVRMREGRDEARVGILDDWMLALAGDVSGLRVIDLGCGEGRFCRMLAARGATTLGVDLQPAFIEHANAHKGKRETYLLGDIEDLAGVPDASFDLAVSYVTLIDVADMDAVVRNAYRVLKPGGRFLVCNLSPMTTGRGPWLRGADRRKLCYILDDYGREGPRDTPFSFNSTFVLTQFHRMMSTHVNCFLDHGFTLQRMHEPTPNAEQLKRAPGLEDLFRAPNFVIFELAKTSAE